MGLSFYACLRNLSSTNSPALTAPQLSRSEASATVGSIAFYTTPPWLVSSVPSNKFKLLFHGWIMLNLDLQATHNKCVYYDAFLPLLGSGQRWFAANHQVGKSCNGSLSLVILQKTPIYSLYPFPASMAETNTLYLLNKIDDQRVSV